MATAYIDVAITGLTNEQCDMTPEQIEDLLKTKFPGVEVELSTDTEYDDDTEVKD